MNVPVPYDGFANHKISFVYPKLVFSSQIWCIYYRDALTRLIFCEALLDFVPMVYCGVQPECADLPGNGGNVNHLRMPATGPTGSTHRPAGLYIYQLAVGSRSRRPRGAGDAVWRPGPRLALLQEPLQRALHRQPRLIAERRRRHDADKFRRCRSRRVRCSPRRDPLVASLMGFRDAAVVCDVLRHRYDRDRLQLHHVVDGAEHAPVVDDREAVRRRRRRRRGSEAEAELQAVAAAGHVLASLDREADRGDGHVDRLVGYVYIRVPGAGRGGWGRWWCT